MQFFYHNQCKNNHFRKILFKSTSNIIHSVKICSIRALLNLMHIYLVIFTEVENNDKFNIIRCKKFCIQECPRTQYPIKLTSKKYNKFHIETNKLLPLSHTAGLSH